MNKYIEKCTLCKHLPTIDYRVDISVNTCQHPKTKEFDYEKGMWVCLALNFFCEKNSEFEVKVK